MKIGAKKKIIGQINKAIKNGANTSVVTLLFMKLITDPDDGDKWAELFKVYCAKAHIKEPEPVVAPDPYDRGGK